MPAPPTPEIRDPDLAARAAAMLMAVLRRSHLAGAHELGVMLAEEARAIGVERLVVYLADFEQSVLVPVPGPGAGTEPVTIAGTLAGRCFAATEAVDAPADAGRRLWLPLLDGTDRLGVVEMTLPHVAGDPAGDLVDVCARLAHLIALLVVTKDHIGGDAYDYALDGDILHTAILDAVGHGIEAAGAATYALSVYRHRRRAGDDLPGTYAAIDAQIADQFGAARYVTGCLTQLDVRRGWLRWVNAGHPAPLLLRRGRFVKALESRRSTPMGVRLDERAPVVGGASLEDGDMVLLYTDGLTEARRPDGRLFSAERLAQFIERRAGTLHDDATAVLVEWRRGGARALLPRPADAR